MSQSHVVIIGGGLAGLSAGCYASASGFRATIIEHGSALGGVCTGWQRGPYHIDGCIRWLTGGPFARLYEELGIVPSVSLRPIEQLATYRNVRDGTDITVHHRLDELARSLSALSPADAGEIQHLIGTARKLVALDPGFDRPREPATMRDAISERWNARHLTQELFDFCVPLSDYAAERIKSVPLRRFLISLLPEDTSVLSLALMLGHLERGHLCRPVGGSKRFRDAIVRSYHRYGGRLRLDATVEEVLVKQDRARGVRLSDGTVIEADHVISTSSMPETILRLLSGRYGLAQHAARLEQWKMFGPLLLVSVGVALPLQRVPSVLHVDQMAPFQVAGRAYEQLYLRVFNDERCAPTGHMVVQAMLTTDYDYWATRGQHYQAARDLVGESVVAAIDQVLPGVLAAQRMVDVATPLTYWRIARSWRGAPEGFMPNRDAVFGRLEKRIDRLGDFYMAGYGIEPGGGVPFALMSGRQAVQLLCADTKRPFVARDQQTLGAAQ